MIFTREVGNNKFNWKYGEKDNSLTLTLNLNPYSLTLQLRVYVDSSRLYRRECRVFSEYEQGI